MIKEIALPIAKRRDGFGFCENPLFWWFEGHISAVLSKVVGFDWCAYVNSFMFSRSVTSDGVGLQDRCHHARRRK